MVVVFLLTVTGQVAIGIGFFGGDERGRGELSEINTGALSEREYI